MLTFQNRMRETVKLAVKGIFAKTGLEVHRIQPLISKVPSIQHSRIYPYATYSPWLTDEDFRRTYEAISFQTMVDKYRCYELWELVGEVARLPTGDLIEVGVWRGGTGCLIARKCQLAGIPATVYLCDNFEGQVKAGAFDTDCGDGDLADATETMVLHLIDKLKLSNVQISKGVFPDETGYAVESKKFRLCHIDVGVYQSAKDIFDWVWSRVVRGGLVIFDEYGFHGCEGITRLVEEQRRNPDILVIHNLNGHAVLVKTT